MTNRLKYAIVCLFSVTPGFLISWIFNKTAGISPMNMKTMKSLGYFIKKSPIEFSLISLMALVLLYAAVPTQALADELIQLSSLDDSVQLRIKAMQNRTLAFGTLPESSLRPPTKTYKNIPVTAYNSVPWQTDSTPCIGAQGTDICAYLEAGSNSCAANFLPLGTVIEVDGLGTCVVRDRMNARYNYRVDWYMGMDVTSAKKFGIKYKEIGVYPS